jgi:hypothetical protein
MSHERTKAAGLELLLYDEFGETILMFRLQF